MTPSEKRRASRGAAKRPSRGRRRSSTGEHARQKVSKRASLQRRRARALLVAAAIFAAIVLATSFPVSTLLSQHKQLSSTTQQVSTLEQQNKALNEEAEQLSDPSTVAGIARRDYGLVAPGSQAYEILPAPGSSAASGQSTGHVPLEGPPVVPGSAQSQEILAAGTTGLAGGGTQGTDSAGSSGTASPSASAGSGKSVSADGPSDGFWTRVLHTLEFWR